MSKTQVIIDTKNSSYLNALCKQVLTKLTHCSHLTNFDPVSNIMLVASLYCFL